MKQSILPFLLVLLLVVCTIAVFSCDFLESEIEDGYGARYQNQQDMVYEQTINDPVE